MGLLPHSWTEWKSFVKALVCTCMKLNTVSLLFFNSSGLFLYPLSHSSCYLDLGGQIYQRNVNFNDFLRRTEVQPYYLDLILFLWLHGLWLWLVVAFGFCLIVLILLLNFLICHFLLLSQWEGWTTKYLHVWWFVFSPRSGAWTVHVDSLHTFKSLFVYLCGSSSRYWILES